MELSVLFGVPKPVIGMIHLPALPGSPGHSLPLDRIFERAAADGGALVEGGVNGLMMENFGDAPFYPRRVPPETLTFMAVLGRHIRSLFSVPLGINVLRNDGLGAIAVAAACDARFVRINVLTGARVADQGILEGEAHEVLRYRKAIGCTALLFADVAVKHSAALGVRDLEDEVADTLRRAGADAVIVSGAATGKTTNIAHLHRAKLAAGGHPVLVGSGACAENIGELLRAADGVIVGTALKRDGSTTNPVDAVRVRALMNAAHAVR